MREGVEERHDRRGHLPLGGQFADEGVQFRARRQMAVPQQKGHLFEAGVGGQVGYVVAAIQEPALMAIDEADVGGAGHHIFEAGLERSLGHNSVPPRRVRLLARP
jgi:hypothetical protein